MKKPIGALITDTHMSDSNIELQKSIYREAIQFCVDNELRFIFHGGDIFESRKSQLQVTLIAFEEILDEIQAAGLQMISIIGNHDKTDYDSKNSFISSYKHHPALRLIEEYDMEAFEGCAIAFLSFFNDEIYNEKLKLLNERINKELDPVCPIMLITHIGVKGARMNNGTVIEGDVKVKAFERFTTVKIGHYHDKQEFANIHYIGSAIQHNYGETSNKGLHILFNDFSTEMIELEFPKYIKYEVDVNTLTQKDLDDLKAEKENSNDYLRIILVGEEREVKAYNVQALKAVGVDVKIKVPDIEIRELQTRVEPFSPKTLISQFEQFCEQNELNLEQGNLYFSQIYSHN